MLDGRQIPLDKTLSDQTCDDLHAPGLALSDHRLAIGGGFAPNVRVSHPLLDLKLLGARLRVELARHPDRHESDASRSLSLGGLVKQLMPEPHGLDGQCQNNFFLIREVIVDGPLGVLHARGDPVHRQRLEPLGYQNWLGHPENVLGSLLNLPLLACYFDHVVNY